MAAWGPPEFLANPSNSKEWGFGLDNLSDGLFIPIAHPICAGQRQKNVWFQHVLKKKVLKMHLLVEKGNNPNNKKPPMGQILVSPAPILDWDSLLIQLGQFQGGIYAREGNPQSEVTRGSQTNLRDGSTSSRLNLQHLILSRQPRREHSAWRCQNKISAETVASAKPWILMPLNMEKNF